MKMALVDPRQSASSAPPTMSDLDELDPRWDGVSIQKEQWHFHRQLLARYGIVLAPGEFSAIIGAINGGQAQLIERRGRNRAIYSIRISRVRERVYVLVAGSRLVTAWPPNKRLNDIRRAIRL
jgi:hypothetical protein